MVSLIHEYEYDLFISYRQKDNKYDGCRQKQRRTDTESFVAWYNLGLGLHFTGNLAAAIQAYERAIDISVNISL